MELSAADPPLLLALVLTTPVVADQQDTGYRMPPSPLPDIIDAPQTPSMSLSPDREWMLLNESPALLPLSDLATPELRLGGLRSRPIHKLTVKSMSDLIT